MNNCTAQVCHRAVLVFGHVNPHEMRLCAPLNGGGVDAGEQAVDVVTDPGGLAG